MSELVTVESMVELRKNMGVLPTLIDVHLAPRQAVVLCKDPLGNLPEDMQHKVQQLFALPEEAKLGDEGLSIVGVTAYGNAIRFMRMMRYTHAEVISSGYTFDDSVRAVIAPYGKSWISPKESYFTLRSMHSIMNPVMWRDPKVRDFVSSVTREFTLEAVISGPGEVVPNGYVLKSLTVYRKALKWLILAKDSRQFRDSIDERGHLIECLTTLKDEIRKGVLPID